MFPDASECHWGSFVTQVPDAEMDQNLPVEDMTHEPLAFLSGTFKGSRSHGACCSSAFLCRFAAQRHRRCQECVSARVQSGGFQMAGVVRVAEGEDRSLIVLVDWVGFEVDERTWEPVK